ncbi:MAG: ADP-glyceromanno-heptose 6-epimerase [Phycisphaerales bacterium]|nr:ADP-glyceromanno-heptose 6-epimerase [Phycisphaerales bacterium]
MYNKKPYIIITGAAGFIGSVMVEWLNAQGITNLILVDDFADDTKKNNWSKKKFVEQVHTLSLFNWLEQQQPNIIAFIHLGANTNTTEFNYEIHQFYNLAYSQHCWQYCVEKQIPLIYASSAATYGDGTQGYDDRSLALIEKLEPLNPYGQSKQAFDIWALSQNRHPPLWIGLKFFNVYGPNEYHKGRMASVVLSAFYQIQKQGFARLFKSYKPPFKDGEQLRDFIYVKDIVEVIGTLLNLPTALYHQANGIYNLGTGTARTFNDLVRAVFSSLQLSPIIEYIDMPLDIRDKYQYYTQAQMDKLKTIYKHNFYTLEEGVKDYVQNYLVNNLYY